MKTCDIDWTGLLAFTERWDGLPESARPLALALGPGDTADANRFAEHLPLLEAAGMLETYKEGERVRPVKAFYPALKVLRLMGRALVFLDPRPETLDLYFIEVLTTEERGGIALCEAWRMHELFPRVVANRSHLDGFLNTKNAARWESDRLVESPYRSRSASTPVLKEPRAAEDLKKLLMKLRAEPRPIAFGDLTVGRMSKRRLADAVSAGLRYALCVTGFDQDFRPALGLHPDIAWRLHREPAPMPERVEPTESFCAAWGIDDVVQLLVFCGEPRRLRSTDASLFAKAESELADQLVRLPAWISFESDPISRISRARGESERRDFVAIAGKPGKTYRLELTDKGRAWLALSASERAREFLAPWIENADENEDLLAAAFEPLAGHVSIGRFLRHQAERANPLLKNASARPPMYGIPPSEGELEALWANRLLDCIRGTLFPHAGASIGRIADEATFELTDVGRYLLGFAKDLEWPDDGEASAIVVQPDFDIVFLAPSPSLEASIARLAERTGRGLGAVFRLTRSSIQSATRAGLTATDILTTLSEASEASLPPNVVAEIEEWCDRCIQLTWEPALLLRFPDEETAARAVSAAKGKLEILSPTVLALTDKKHRAAVTNACRKAGVFLEYLDEEPSRRKKRRRRARYWG